MPYGSFRSDLSVATHSDEVTFDGLLPLRVGDWSSLTHEADVSVVLHPELMTPQNLYVALTRGARHVVVCSPTPILTPVVNG